MAGAGNPVQVNISVAGEHLGDFDQVVRALEAAGLSVEQRLPSIGVVSGSIDAARVPELGRVAGVGAVEPSREIHLAPPESDVQ